MTPEQSALQAAIAVADGQSELARKLTAISERPIKQQQVWNWLHREKRTPISQVLAIERITGVPKEQLRPDVFQKNSN